MRKELRKRADRIYREKRRRAQGMQPLGMDPIPNTAEIASMPTQKTAPVLAQDYANYRHEARWAVRHTGPTGFYRLKRFKYFVCNIYDATLKIIAVAKVKANIVIHICSSIAWQAGARPVSQPRPPRAIGTDTGMRRWF